MKKLLPILIFSLLINFAQAQRTNLGVTADGLETQQQELAVIKNIENKCELASDSGVSQKPLNAKEMVGGIPLGSAGNLYTIIRGTSNMVAANQDLNSIVFIHRNNDEEFGDKTSQYRFDVSTDGGSSFTNNIGPANTLSDHTTGPNSHGRYPQVAIYNPSGNSDPSNALMIYQGATHSGSTSPDTWDGVAYGSLSMDGDLSTLREGNALPNNQNVLIPNSLVQGLPGEFWSVDFEFFGGDDVSNLLLYKLTVDEATGEVSFDNYAVLDPEYDLRYDGLSRTADQQIAFDPSGMNGWIMFSGDAAWEGGPFVYSPIFWQTQDGGVTWQGPSTLNMDNFHGEGVDSLKFVEFTDGTVIDLPLSLSFDATDLVVDQNGDPHLACVVTSNGLDLTTQEVSSYSIFLAGLVGDLTYNSAEEQWKFLSLAQLEVPRDTVIIWDDGSPASNNFRIQASTDSDGSKVFISYLDSDPEDSDGPGRERDLRGFGIDVTTSKVTPLKHYTKGDPDFDGKAFYATVPAHVLKDGSTYKIPAVFTEIVADGTDLLPFNFFYFTDANIDESEFTEDPGINLYQPTPPPVYTFSYENIQNNEYTFTIDGTVCEGCIVLWDFGDGSTSDETNPTHVLPNVNNTFTITLTVTNSDGSSNSSQQITIAALDDTEAPVLTLVGGEEVTISAEAGTLYEDPGYSAIDLIDGDITDQVIVTGAENVNQENVGTYTVTYDVSDAAGNSASATRTVIIVDDKAPVITISPSALQADCLAEIDLLDPDNGGFNVIVTDNIDTNLQAEVCLATLNDIECPNICTSMGGLWFIEFCVTDATGNSTSEVRPVQIADGQNDNRNSSCEEVPCITGFEDDLLQASVQISPNPSADRFYIDFSGVLQRISTLKVFNILGEEVVIKDEITSNAKLVIDLSRQPSGIYFMEILSENAKATFSLVKN